MKCILLNDQANQLWNKFWENFVQFCNFKWTILPLVDKECETNFQSHNWLPMLISDTLLIRTARLMAESHNLSALNAWMQFVIATATLSILQNSKIQVCFGNFQHASKFSSLLFHTSTAHVVLHYIFLYINAREMKFKFSLLIQRGKVLQYESWTLQRNWFSLPTPVLAAQTSVNWCLSKWSQRNNRCMLHSKNCINENI